MIDEIWCILLCYLKQITSLNGTVIYSKKNIEYSYTPGYTFTLLLWVTLTEKFLKKHDLVSLVDALFS